MKHLLFCLLAFSPLLAYGGADTPGCPKDADACVAAPARRSAFLEAAAKLQPAAAQPAKAAKKAAAAVKAVAAAGVPTAAVAGSTVTAADAPVVPQPAASSNPLWVLFAGAGLAGLYFYLRSGSAKKKRR
jgi:hypothetical protein